jgi:hypothetical protein
VRWLWEGRLPLGELALSPGRGGIGKSTFHAWLAAQITNGLLPGEYMGTPRAVVVMTTEDSWARTVIPRLMVAGANLKLVYRVDVMTEADSDTTLQLPADGAALAGLIAEIEAVMVSLDPLLSTIARGLDTHKNAEVRAALEPLKALAEASGCTVLGNAHFNKGRGSDPVSLVTGSSAFGDVARAVIGFAHSRETDEYVLTQLKNNLGRLDLPSLKYEIVGKTIATDEGPATAGLIEFVGESSTSVHDLLSATDGSERHQVDAAAEWLESALRDGPLLRKEVESFARSEGYTGGTLQRAREKLSVVVIRDDNARGRPSTWQLPDYEPSPQVSTDMVRNQSASDLEQREFEIDYAPDTNVGSNSSPQVPDGLDLSDPTPEEVPA